MGEKLLVLHLLFIDPFCVEDSHISFRRLLYWQYCHYDISRFLLFADLLRNKDMNNFGEVWVITHWLIRSLTYFIWFKLNGGLLWSCCHNRRTQSGKHLSQKIQKSHVTQPVRTRLTWRPKQSTMWPWWHSWKKVIFILLKVKDSWSRSQLSLGARRGAPWTGHGFIKVLKHTERDRAQLRF